MIPFFFGTQTLRIVIFFSARAKCNAAVCHVFRIRHAKRAKFFILQGECIYFVLDVCTSLAHLSLVGNAACGSTGNGLRERRWDRYWFSIRRMRDVSDRFFLLFVFHLYSRLFSVRVRRSPPLFLSNGTYFNKRFHSVALWKNIARKPMPRMSWRKAKLCVNVHARRSGYFTLPHPCERT